MPTLLAGQVSLLFNSDAIHTSFPTCLSYSNWMFSCPAQIAAQNVGEPLGPLNVLARFVAPGTLPLLGQRSLSASRSAEGPSLVGPLTVEGGSSDSLPLF